MVKMKPREFVNIIGCYRNYKQEFTVTSKGTDVKCVAFAGNFGVSCLVLEIDNRKVTNILSKIRVKQIDGHAITAKIEGIHENLILTESGLFAVVHGDGSCDSFVVVNGIRVEFSVLEYMG